MVAIDPLSRYSKSGRDRPARSARTTLAGVAAGLSGSGRDTGNRAAVALRGGCEVADHEHLRMTGNREVGFDDHSTRPVEWSAEVPRQRRCGHASGPEHRARLDPPVRRVDTTGVDADHAAVGAHVDTELGQMALRFAPELVGIRGEHVVGAFDQHHLRRRRVDRPELAGHGVCRDLAQGTGQLDPGRSTADDDEREQRAADVLGTLALGRLERGEDAPPDVERVLDRLQTRRVLGPRVVAEVVVPATRGDDQRVVGE